MQSAGAVSDIFLSQTPNSTNFTIEGRPDPPPNERVEVPVDSATPGFFKTMGVQLLKGRFFEDRDGRDAPPVVMINEKMARQFWPGEEPLGKRIKRVHLKDYRKAVGSVDGFVDLLSGDVNWPDVMKALKAL